MSFRAQLASLALVLGVAGQLSAQKVSTDWDHSAKWSNYNSYYIDIQKSFATQLMNERGVAAVDSALQSKGWKKVPTLDAASAAVLLSAIAQKDETSTTMYTGGGYGGWGYRGGGMGMATTSTSQYTVGTLVVDIFDVKSKQLLFRGQAQETVSSDPAKNTKNLYKATEKMFKDFPPTASK